MLSPTLPLPPTLPPAHPPADIVQRHGAALSVAAKEWVERYRQDRAEATAELLSFLLQASARAHACMGGEERGGQGDGAGRRLTHAHTHLPCC